MWAIQESFAVKPVMDASRRAHNAASLQLTKTNILQIELQRCLQSSIIGTMLHASGKPFIVNYWMSMLCMALFCYNIQILMAFTGHVHERYIKPIYWHGPVTIACKKILERSSIQRLHSTVWTLRCVEFRAKPYETCCCEKDTPSNAFSARKVLHFGIKTFSWIHEKR